MAVLRTVFYQPVQEISSEQFLDDENWVNRLISVDAAQVLVPFKTPAFQPVKCKKLNRCVNGADDRPLHAECLDRRQYAATCTIGLHTHLI
ncbi:hypothetical protein KIN20_027225 [Parelaphostrongylus tenuis]|uniref:Uncharacterized protein n=1 Tax=Parelaphostrongylus tenuis TaxID=148309 RepID=A0AAD5WDK4_PARTN|nr:hypothetical protein KIN20_027225 [Parelaphostrongylus tenuis]